MNRIAIILVAAVAIVAGCSRPGIAGDGVIKAEDRSITDFSRVTYSGNPKSVEDNITGAGSIRQRP